MARDPADEGGELWGLGLHRDEEQGGAQPYPGRPSIYVEAKEARRVALAEKAEELGVRGMAEPALADEGGAYKCGGEADAQEDLNEEVVVVEHLGYRHHGCRRRMLLRLAIGTRFLLWT